jgi:CheY-like chemotaxis protein
MLGHELRNPLGAITAGLHVMDIAGPLDERGVRARAIVTRQVGHLVRLVDDLLDVTRLTTGKIALTLVPVDLGAVARRAVSAAASTAPDRRIACDAAADVWVSADETRLEQILMNLVSNAVKFTPPDGRIAVSVSAEGGEAVLRVTDTGAGMRADLLPRIFDLFVQGQTDLHRPLSGLGIGLTLVKRLVDLHGGHIEAASEGPGLGSVFTVHLPRIEAPGAAVAGAGAASASRGGRRVLIVEDNQDSRDMLRHVLELAGHEVHEAEDGASGVERALALHPFAVVVDVGLPGLDGYEVARRIRASDLRDVLLLALTGYGQAEDRRRSREAGFDVHLTKPVDPGALLDRLAAGPRSGGG